MKNFINKCMDRVRKIILNDDGSTAEVEVLVEELTLQEYNTLQIEWIEKHKYFLSQRNGYDVGFNKACIDWVNSGFAKYFRQLFKIKTLTKGTK